jgi:hypothetical protein
MKNPQKIRQYIRYNHLKWNTDIENPKNYSKTTYYYEKLLYSSFIFVNSNHGNGLNKSRF